MLRTVFFSDLVRRRLAAGAALGLAAAGLTLVPAASAGELTLGPSASASMDDPACELRDLDYPAYVVPAGVHFVTIDAYGAAGHPGHDITTTSAIGITTDHGGGAGGVGAHVRHLKVPVTPGQKLYSGTIPGGQGGGDNRDMDPDAGNGGEAIWVGTIGYQGFCKADGLSLLAVAGGGGGGGDADANGPGGTGGNAGAPGNPGGDNQNTAGGGGGAATDEAPGAGGAGGNLVEIAIAIPFYTETPQYPGEPGKENGGGGSGDVRLTRLGTESSGGGGGGGMYGGGGGGASGHDAIAPQSGNGSGGGGGGSSWPHVVGTSTSFYSDVDFTPIFDSGLTFSASPDPAIAGEPVTLTATVTSPIEGQPLGGGLVDFYDRGDPDYPGRQTIRLGTFPVDASATSWTKSVTVPGMTRGYHEVKASYSGFNGIFVDADDIGYSIDNAPAMSLLMLEVQGEQSISFTSPPPAAKALDATYTPTATSTSGLPVSLSIDSSSASVCSMTNGVVSFLSGGTCTINADQAGDDLTAPAQMQQAVIVAAATEQAITFTTTAPATMEGGDTYTPRADGGGSGNPVVITASSSCRIEDGTVVARLGGTCAIRANQAGGNGYSAAPEIRQSIKVHPLPGHALFYSTPPDSPQIGEHYTVIGQVLYPSYGVTTAVLTVDADSTACTMSEPTGKFRQWGVVQEAVVTYTAVGTCIIDVDRRTSGQFDPPPSQVQPIAQLQQVSTVAGAAQDITFTSDDPADPMYGGSTTVSATSTSGLPVTFTSATPSTCSVSGADVVAFVGAGECQIRADQGGDTTRWGAAPTATKTLEIAAAPLTITAPAGSSVYGTAPTTFAPTYDGFVGDDDATSLSTKPLCARSSASPDAGGYPVTCSGAVDPDYTFDYVDGTETITRAPLTITASSGTTGYGLAVPTVTASYAGLTNGDTELATAPTCDTDATDHSDVGDYATSCTDAADPNYTITTVDGEISITEADLIVTASSADRSYGDAAPEIAASYVGLQGGDTAPATLPTCTSPVDADTAPGDYASTCSGAADSNYTIGYADGTVQVTPAPLTVIAPNPTTPHGTPVAIDPQYEGLVGEDAAPATAATCQTTATSSSPVGTYPVDCSGAADPNYTIDYRSGSVTVAPAPLSVTASSASIVWGSPMPDVVPSYSGLVLGQTAPATPPVCSTAATRNSDVGDYATSCKDAADPNYTITTVDGELSITKAPLTITASSGSAGYGLPVPTVTASYSGFRNGDTLPTTEPTCGTDAARGSAVGDYATSCKGAADPNYSFEYVDGEIGITKAPLIITASSADRSYGDPTSAITANYRGLLGKDAAPETRPHCTSPVRPHTRPGDYVSRCSGAADPNYAIDYRSGSVTVAPAPLTVTASSASIVWGSPVPDVVPSYSGLVLGQKAPATPPVCSTAATRNSDVGDYATSCKDAADPNYTITTVDGEISITKATLVTPPDVSGRRRVGHTLTATPGVWHPADAELSFGWFRDGEEIPGATGLRYVLRPQDLGSQIQLGVAASATGSLTSFLLSDPTREIRRGKLIKKAKPRIIGKTTVGNQLVLRTGRWSPSTVEVHQQWKAGKQVIADRTGKRLRVRPWMVGKKIRARVVVSTPGYRTVVLPVRAKGRVR